MFTTLIVQPIFNLLVLIYALIPGHNFGLAIIIFTIIVRMLLWPLVKRQLHQAKLMRQLQPELKRIAKETKGDRQKQAMMQMELYKEKGVSPGRSLGVVLLQLPILIGLYAGLSKLTKDPHQIVNFAYPAIRHLPWMQELAHGTVKFDNTLFGVVDLHRAAIPGLYIPALIIVVASAVVQYFQAKQLMPKAEDNRGLRTILKEAGTGKQADQTEVNAAVSRVTIFFLPAMIFFFTVSLPSALPLYWLVGGIVAYIQQSIVLREDEQEMEVLAGTGKNVKAIPEAETVGTTTEEDPSPAETSTPKPKAKKSSKKKAAKKRRKR
jgi:YidC/Oxa1 family membrane protein insertase